MVIAWLLEILWLHEAMLRLPLCAYCEQKKLYANISKSATTWNSQIDSKIILCYAKDIHKNMPWGVLDYM